MSSEIVRHPTTEVELNEIFSSSTYVIIDFYADWCPPCKAIAPRYAQFAKSYSVPNILTFVKINVDEMQAFAGQHSISSIPSFMFFKEGKKVAANGMTLVQDVGNLAKAVEKIGGLAKKRAEAA